jgi:hypothetical protein
MKQIPLTRGQVALVDDEDYKALKDYRWYALPRRVRAENFYAYRWVIVDGKRKTEYMHRRIMGVVGRTSQVDHINCNPLDNRRSNLRLATHSQNCANIPWRGNATGFKGVRKHPQGFQMVVAGKGKKVYDNPVDAARAYDKAALEKWGEFVVTNESLGNFARASA